MAGVAGQQVDVVHVPGERQGVATAPVDLGSDEMLPSRPDLLACELGTFERGDHGLTVSPGAEPGDDSDIPPRQARSTAAHCARTSGTVGDSWYAWW